MFQFNLGGHKTISKNRQKSFKIFHFIGRQQLTVVQGLLVERE